MGSVKKKFKGGKHNNAKTGLSFDTSTICPLTAAGKPCAYCYVNTQRVNGGYLKKGLSNHDPYDGWVLRLRQETVDKLNGVGGIRMFSFSDYHVKHRKDIERFLGDCDMRNLRAKAITKQISFIKHHHDNPVISVIHLSIDNLKGRVGRSPITHPMAKRMRELYDKVIVRAVILNDEDAEYFGGQDWVDVLTFNHGGNGFKQFRKVDLKAAAKKYPNRVCCVGENCFDCETKCGLYAHVGVS